MSPDSGAKCAGQWWLFDSTNPVMHRQAAELCSGCPAIIACRELLREEQAIAHTMRTAGGGPRGTWAGRLVGKPERGRNGRANPREHGTDRGYHQHRYANDRVCDECREAHRLAERARKESVA